MTRGKAIAVREFRRAGGVLTTGEALRRGVHPRDLYALRDEGVIEALARGVYRLTELPPLSDPDLVSVALAVPKAVIAVLSALHFHGLTTQIPHEVSIALPRGDRAPRLGWPPLRIYRLSGAQYTTDIEEHQRDGTTVRVYGAAKSVVDAFRFRNRIGTDVAVEALRTGLAERRFTPADILRLARLARVERVVRPYLEALQ